MDTPKQYCCNRCGHMFFYHRESFEWRLLNPRRRLNVTGCAKPGCTCAAVDASHVKGQK